MLAFKPKKDSLPIHVLIRSSVFVRGDRNTSIKPAWGIESRSMNSPLTNIKGILKKFRGIITSPGLPVVVGTHPMPQNYIDTHEKAGDWDRDDAREFLKNVTGDPKAARKYDSMSPNFLQD
jgi:hypothetical protein